MKHRIIATMCVLLLGMSLGIAQAKVSPEEAAKLKTELTPMGAIRAGSADGMIPEWTGGVEAPAGYDPNSWLIDIFPNEKPLFTITKENYKKYADKLAPSQIESFQRFKNLKMDIYPTHRTVSAPDWVINNTYNNALNAQLVDEGNGVEGACGGIPFPIPQSGGEAIQNLLMRYWGSNIQLENYGVSGYQNSSAAPTYAAKAVFRFPYYQKEQKVCGDGLLSFTNLYTVPARRKGEQLIVRDYLNASKRPREAWQYIPGQRRVRRAPTIAFDTPDMAISTFDDAYTYNGSPERYNWKLIGKKEMYIPYNGYKLISAWAKGKLTLADMTPESPTSDLLFRWELHRVWIVEGTLKKGARHIYAKRIFYIDEDSWNAGIQDRYDAKGKLWRYSWSNLTYYYGKGDKFVQARPILQKDIQSGEYMLWFLDRTPLKTVAPVPDQYFTPAGMRKRARR